MVSNDRRNPTLMAKWLARGMIAFAAIISLNACASGSNQFEASNSWLPASSPKMLDVDRAQYRHVIYFETDRDEIRADQNDRLLAFLEAVGPGLQDRVRLEGHADERATELYNLDLAARRIESVKKFLVSFGVDKHNIEASAFGEEIPLSSESSESAWAKNRRVEIVLERYVVTPPACPDWSRRSGRDYTNQPHSNFGCATETNLGLMIADPRDLVRGRSLGSADGVHQAAGVARYREGELAELREERID